MVSLLWMPLACAQTANDLYETCRQDYKAAKYDEAVSACQKAIQLDPHVSMYYSILGTVYDKQKKYDEAIETYQKAIQVDPKNAKAFTGLGEVYLNQRRYDEAFKVLQQAIELDPQHAMAYNNLGVVYIHQKNYEKAFEVLQRAISLDPQNAKAYVNLGLLYTHQKKYEAAIDAEEKAINLDPQDAIAYNNLGNAYINQRDYEKAFEVLQTAISLNPQYALSYYNLGKVYIAQNKNEKAIEAYQKAISLDPQNAQAYNNLGNVYSKQKDYLQAAKAFQEARKLNPPTTLPQNVQDIDEYRGALKKSILQNWHPDPTLISNPPKHIQILVTTSKNGELSDTQVLTSSHIEALDNSLIEAVHKTSPFTPLPLSYKKDTRKFVLGFSYPNNVNPKTAQGGPNSEPDFNSFIKELQQKVRSNWHPINSPIVNNIEKQSVVYIIVAKNGHLLGTDILESSGSEKWDQACLSAVKRAAPFPSLPEDYSGEHVITEFTFEIHLNGKYSGQASEIYRKPSSIDPQNANDYVRLGLAYSTKQKYEQAIEAYQKAISLDPKNVYAYTNLGNVHFHQKDYGEAIESYQKAVSLDPQNAEAYGNLGAAYIEQKDYAQAMTALQKAVNLDSHNAKVYSNLGVLYFNQKDYGQAITAFQKALSIDPQNAHVYYNLGYVYTLEKNYEAAFKALQKAFNLDPHYAQAYPALDNSYFKELQQKIVSFWHPINSPTVGIDKPVMVYVRVAKDGSLLGTGMLKSSGSVEWDQACLSAVKRAAPFKPLPENHSEADFIIEFSVRKVKGYSPSFIASSKYLALSKRVIG